MNILIVDMMEGFARQGILASPRVEALIPKQVEFLQACPQDTFVVFACDSHHSDDSELKRMPPHCMKGTDEALICQELIDVVVRRRLSYEIVYKTTHSAFFETEMDDVIRDKGDDWIVFGCVTDICISANVAELDYRGKNVTVVRDLVDTYDITKDQAEAMGDETKTHNCDVFNNLWLDFYLPGVWGVKIMDAKRCLEDETIRNCAETKNY